MVLIRHALRDRLGDLFGIQRVDQMGIPFSDLLQRGGVRSDNGDSRSHRLDDRKSESLVQGREEKESRSLVESGKHLVIDMAQELESVCEAQLRGPLPDLELDRAAVTDTDQVRIERVDLQRSSVGLDDVVQVLVWFRVADEQHVGPVDLEFRQGLFQLLPGNLGSKGLGNTWVDDSNFPAIDVEILHEVRLGVLRVGDDAIAPRQAAPDHSLGVEERQRAGQKLWVQQVNDVVDRNNCLTGHDGRQHVMGRVVEVQPKLEEPPG